MHMLDRKAQGLSMNTIIIAAIAIIVLLILIYLLVGTTGDVDSAISCTKKGGVCMERCEGIYGDSSLGSEPCGNIGKTCCLPGTN